MPIIIRYSETPWLGKNKRRRRLAAIQSPDGVHIIGFQTVEGYEPPVWPWADEKQAQMMHLDFSAGNVDEAVAFALECGAKAADVQYFDMARVMLDLTRFAYVLRDNPRCR